MSFTRAPDVFLYRELIPGTKKYRYKVIDGANTLEASIDKSLDAHNALRSEFFPDTLRFFNQFNRIFLSKSLMNISH